MICSALFWENEAVYNPECSPGKQQFQSESSPQTHRLFIAASADYFSVVIDSFLVYKMSESSTKNLMWCFYMSCFIWPAVQNQKIQFNMIWTQEKQKKSPYLTGWKQHFQPDLYQNDYRFKNDHSGFLSINWVTGCFINAALIMHVHHVWSAFFNSFHWSFDLWGKPVAPYLVGQPGRLLVGVCSSWHWMVSIHQSSVFRLLLCCNACTEAAVRSFSLLYLAFFPECVGKDTTLDPLYKMSPVLPCPWAELRLNRGRGAYSLLTN